MSTIAVMKHRTPISMFNVFKTSNRKSTHMVTPTPDIQYVYNASITWNWARQVIKCLKKWAIHVSGTSTGTSWCYFDFDFYEIYLTLVLVLQH